MGFGIIRFAASFVLVFLFLIKRVANYSELKFLRHLSYSNCKSGLEIIFTLCPSNNGRIFLE